MEDNDRGKMLGLIRDNAEEIIAQSGREVRVLREEALRTISEKSGMPLNMTYRDSLKSGALPYRYIRNLDSIDSSDQLRLAESKVVVLGAGGLGGHVISLLARTGVGSISIVDRDIFDESNLNRQSFCKLESIGRSKAREASGFVAEVNPGVEVICCRVNIDEHNCNDIMNGADVVADCLDSIGDRLLVGDCARRLKIPLVHGAIAGFEGQVATIFPEDEGLYLIYGGYETGEGDSPGAEALLGVTAPAASLVGTLQAMEVIKVLIGKGRVLRNSLLHIDLESCQFEKFSLKN